MFFIAPSFTPPLREATLSALASCFLMVGAIVFHYGCSEEEIVKGSGANDPHVLVRKPDGTFVANPTHYGNFEDETPKGAATGDGIFREGRI